MQPKGIRAPANIADQRTRQEFQNLRDILNPLLGIGNNKENRAITQGELISLGLAVSDGMGGINSIIEAPTSSLQQTFLTWLEESFLAGSVFSADFTVGAEVGNVINVSVQLKDQSGNNISGIRSITGYLSSNSAGANFATTPPSGGVVVGSNGDVFNLEGDIVFQFISSTTGLFDVDITHVGAATFHLALITLGSTLSVSPAITFV